MGSFGGLASARWTAGVTHAAFAHDRRAGACGERGVDAVGADVDHEDVVPGGDRHVRVDGPAQAAEHRDLAHDIRCRHVDGSTNTISQVLVVRHRDHLGSCVRHTLDPTSDNAPRRKPQRH